MRDSRTAKLRAKAEKGDVEAMVELADEWLQNTDPEALVWLTRAAERGSAEAEASLGFAREKGMYGASVDLGRAVEHYQRALAGGVRELGPEDLEAHTKKLVARLRRRAKPDHDPIDELFVEAKLEKQKDAILAARSASIRWIATPAKDAAIALGASKLGGCPDLPPGTPWPTGAGRALEHVATVCFADAPPLDGIPAVEGRLVFFYDAKNQAWGDEDDESEVDEEQEDGVENDGAWAVLHVRGQDLVRTKPPRGTTTFKPSRLEGRIEVTLPAVTSHAGLGLGLTDRQTDNYRDLLEAWPTADASLERHRSFGHADVTDDSDGPDPVLLLQVDSYEHGDINWGDAGALFWWIQPADLAAGRFDRLRFQLQT